MAYSDKKVSTSVIRPSEAKYESATVISADRIRTKKIEADLREKAVLPSQEAIQPDAVAISPRQLDQRAIIEPSEHEREPDLLQGDAPVIEGAKAMEAHQPASGDRPLEADEPQAD
ncbi:hypothetical protein [Pelagicoccus sp. SDUM812003]|uniref:hypothetical protein n=1 Tax=Pelagicoccus sp. SDUM812003 TaxID=3041267 RepID=UPI00280CAF62|nr:hypothetical protein [Pelagicoccus sp. SDUM812003]MDQ8202657.1 hypothetical protein [Pelagicoccus sp. SDUM812003]